MAYCALMLGLLGMIWHFGGHSQNIAAASMKHACDHGDSATLPSKIQKAMPPRTLLCCTPFPRLQRIHWDATTNKTLQKSTAYLC